MQFNNVTDKNGIIQKIELLLNFSDGQISGDATLLKQFTSLVNDAYNEITTRILEWNIGWRWDDSAYTEFPRGTADLVADQTDYELPPADPTVSSASVVGHLSSFLSLDKVSVLDASGFEHVLRPTNRSEAELNVDYPISGLPIWYKLVGQSIKIWPAANADNVTTTDGLVVYYTRIPEQFSSSDTTKQPGFAAPFHQILAYKAAFEYASTKEFPSLNSIQLRIVELTEGLKDLYVERNKDDQNLIIPRSARERYN